MWKLKSTHIRTTIVSGNGILSSLSGKRLKAIGIDEVR
jgi:hypothetical protein